MKSIYVFAIVAAILLAACGRPEQPQNISQKDNFEKIQNEAGQGTKE